MKVFDEILEVMKCDTEHFVRFKVDGTGFGVYLIYDPEMEFGDNIVIPINYDKILDGVYVSDDEYREMFNPGEGGIEHTEIVLIDRIMGVMEANLDEIRSMCEKCNIYGRK